MGEWTELRYAKQLAINLWEKHYKGSSPDWEPLDDLMGVLTQIDNMTCGLWPVEDEPTRKEWEEWTENMPSHSMSTRMQWEGKMKAWFLTMPGIPKEKP